MSKNTAISQLINGILKENPVFFGLLGFCPALAVTTDAYLAVSMGLVTMVVLILSSLCISRVDAKIPDQIRFLCHVTIIAFFVTLAELLMSAFVPDVADALGIYLPLVAVNCLIMQRVQTYAVKNNALMSFLDACGMGMGFTLALFLIGASREIMGSASLFGLRIMPEAYVKGDIFILAPGAFFVLAFLLAIYNKLRHPSAAKPVLTVDEAQVMEPVIEKEEVAKE